MLDGKKTKGVATIMKAYLDNNVVSSIVRDDNLSESQALTTLLTAYNAHNVNLVTSDLTLVEIMKCPPKYQAPLERTFYLLKKIPVVKSHTLLYINSYGTPNAWINSPVFQNDPLYDSLLALGLDQVDAEHILTAAKQECSAFLTCDNSKRTGILRRGKEIKDLCGLVVQRPSDFVLSQDW